MLAIGDGKAGFSLKKLDNAEMKERVKRLAARSVLPKEVEQGIREHRKQRSAKYGAMAEARPLPQRSTWQRWVRIWRIAKPSHVYLRFVAVIFFIVVQTWIEDKSALLTGSMMGALMNNQPAEMWRLSRYSLACAAVLGWMWEQMLYVERTLGLVMSDRFERHLAGRLAKNNMSYKMAHVDGRIKDIDQRVAMDGGILLRHNIGHILIGFVRPTIKVFWFTWRIYKVTKGWQVPALMIVYYLLSGYAQKLCMPDFRALYQKHSKLEAKFHTAHARVKVCAESIAFFDGGAREKKIVDRRFHDVMAQEWYRLKVDFRFNCVKDIFERRIPDVLNWFILFRHGVQHGGTDEEMLADGGSAINTGQTQITILLPQITNNLGQVLQLAAFIAEMAGKIDRTAEMQEVLDELEDKEELAEIEREKQRRARKGEEEVSVVMEGCDIVTPRGECIVSDLSLKVSEGQGLMVTGRGGTGKSKIFRHVLLVCVHACR